MADPVLYNFSCIGRTKIIIHRNDVMSADKVQRWREERRQDKKILKGDDRYPCWTWKTYLYHDGECIVVPTANIGSALSRAGTQFSLNGSRKSLKAAAVSCIIFPHEYLRVIPAGKKAPIKMKDVIDIDDDAPFEEHIEPAAKLGILLDVRRVPIGQRQHVRVRPCLPPGWRVEGTFYNMQPYLIPEEQLKRLWTSIGEFEGLCDWRPGAPHHPGQHGKFETTISRAA